MKPRIVIVQDDSGSVEDLCALFDDANFEAQGFTEADKALSYIVTNKCDLVCLEIIMDVPKGWDATRAKKTGIELAKRIKQSKSKLPIVALTIYGDEGLAVRKEMGAAGISIVISKPTNFGKILEEVKKLLNR